ncbi:MAG TPA: TcpQ domain-containing protein [Micavibrio sp.]
MKNTKMFMWHLMMAAALPALFTTPAQAGFEWSPPPAAPAISSAQSTDALPPVSASPAGNVEATELMPIPGTTEVRPPADINADMNAAPLSPALPVIERESQALPKPDMDRMTPPVATGPFAVAQGFGADIPLALALGQIVPAEYAYSFASNVNPGLKISWDGGKPWNIVLNEALAVHDLRADIAGTAVIVRKGVAAAAAQPAPESQQGAALDMNAAAAPLQMSASDPVVPPTASGGEGSANYPRRHAAKQPGFFQSIFTPEEQKGNQAPRPPLDQQPAEGPVATGNASDGKVMVRNEVSAEELGAMNAAPAEAAALEPAALEPAAPAMAPLDTNIGGPVPLNTQKISYADEELRQHSDILPDRAPAELSATMAAFDPFKVSFWQADNNANLRDTLTAWSQKAGVEVIWDSGYDYKLPGSIAMHGTFPDAVARVFELYGKVEPRPQGKLHPNLPKGPSVLLVENYP